MISPTKSSSGCKRSPKWTALTCTSSLKDTTDARAAVAAPDRAHRAGLGSSLDSRHRRALHSDTSTRLLNPPCPAGMASPPPGFEPVEIALANGLRLRGWWRPPQNGAAVVLMAGHGGTRDAMLPEAQLLAAQGYGALTLDYRQCAGQPVGLGALEVEEFHAALDFVQAQPGVEWVAALGFSAGGSAVLRGSVSRPEVRAVIAEGHYANLWSEILLTPPSRPLSFRMANPARGGCWCCGPGWESGPGRSAPSPRCPS